MILTAFIVLLVICVILLFISYLRFQRKYRFHLNKENSALLASRNINRIILEELDYDKVIQKIADYIPSEMQFATGVLAIIDTEKKVIRRAAASKTKEAEEAIKALKVPFNEIEIPLQDEHNLMARAIREQKSFTTENVYDVFIPVLSEAESRAIQAIMSTKTTIVYPIYIKKEPIGVFVASTPKSKADLSQEELDIIQAFVDGAAIALQHAFLYTNLKKISDNLKFANERLQSLDKLKDEFVSLASHELRTPMTAIKSYLWLFLNDKTVQVSEKQKSYLLHAYESIDRLIAFVNEMLNISRIESGRLVLTLRAQNIIELVQDVITEILPAAQKEENTIEIVQPQQPLSNVMADTDKIREVLINLLGNAIKFTPTGGKISVTFTQQNNMVTTSIKDTGRGISKDDMAKLFQKFQRVGENYLVKQNVQGTGLGLYLTKSIVELHGGKIWVESEGEGKGATFSFSLKIASTEQDTVSLQPQSPQVLTDS